MRRLAAALLVGLALSALSAAQSKPPLTRSDYGQWESLAPGGPRGGLSPDGAWIACAINRSSRDNELRFLRLADRMTHIAAFGTQPAYSSDSAWAAYAIGYSEDEQERMRQERRPIQTRLGLLNLASGEATTTEGVQAFSFSRDGKYLAIRRYAPAAATPAGAGAGAAPAPAGTGASAAAAAEPRGVTVIVRELATGRDTTFGNVTEHAWQDSPDGRLLAMTIGAEGQVGNGVHLLDPATGVLRVLDSAAATFTGLAWRKDSADLAVLRSHTDEARDGPTHRVLAWRGLGTPAGRHHAFDPVAASALPAGQRVVSDRRPAWSEDGGTIFVGVAGWDEKPAPARGRGAGRGGTPAGEASAPPTPASPPRDEPASVEIWHWKDADVMARQKVSAAADRRRNLQAAWHLDANRLVPIGRSFTEQVTLVRGSRRAYVEDWTAYAMARSIGRSSADLYLVDLDTGERSRLRERVDDRYANISPGGRYVLYLENNHYWTIDVATRAVTNITRNVKTSFVDLDSDATVAQKPPFGVAGWTKDDGAVVMYDRFDIWTVRPDGSGATRLTDGAGDEVRHRLLRLNADAEWIDLDADRYVSLFGYWSKKSGFGRLASGGRSSVERLVWGDWSVGGLAKAEKTDVYAYISQTYEDSPDLFVTGPDLANPRQVTSTNEFQTGFAWSRAEVIEYRSEKGRRLQGALYYPANYQPGRAYPMIVYMYERLSDNVHRYVAPSDRDYYNTTVFTSQGYFVLQPDIVFRPREPGLSVVECVRPAVKAVVDRGLADPKRVGIIGHSWGGFDTAFLATNTDVFAAGVAGAGITNLVSNYGNHHWSSGIAETDHIETGQQRMEVPLYEDLQAYIRNSAVFNAHRMTTPLMLMTGDNDGTVYWHQSVEFYNIARRAGRNVVMLVYNGEDHGLRQKKNQVDYQARILAWFAHYLKGDAAPSWVTDGQTFIDREAEVRRAGSGGGR